MALIPIDRIVAGLEANADRLARELLPGGHRDGHDWREARTAQGGLGDSLAIYIGPGSRRGKWMHGAANESGDVLDFVSYIKFGGDKKQAIVWAKNWLGLESGDAGPSQAVTPPVRDDRADEGAAQRRNAAMAIYLAGSDILGSPVETYLAGRGLEVRRLPFPTRALKYHPALWDRHTGRKWPAMVAAITGTDGKFLAVHQTFLEQIGGQVRKAPIVDAGGSIANKRVLGSYRGGCIRLWRGTRVDPKTGEVLRARPLGQCKSGVWVDLTEGIEDGLTVALADHEARVLVAVSLSNMSNIVLPACVEGVMLWPQNDAPGSAAEKGFLKAAAHFRQSGKRVAETRPPMGVKDVNDMLQAGTRTEIAS